ncbi:hypothetical protein M0802_009347 [Mischocyttarus mexicanus]|nr:hypothetical protein M0802_009347 [Mischocyttarus mexicanus]
MSRVIFALLVLVAVASAFPPSKQCPENEEFASCGSACEPTCDNTELKACTLECVIGCQCKEGFIRQSQNGPCVNTLSC